MSSAVKAAAQWWADQLAGNPKFDNGDTNGQSFVAGLMAASLRKKPAVDQVERFKETLEGILAVKRAASPGWPTSVSVDYGPDRILSDALKASVGDYNEMSILPWKTTMWVEDDNVKVRCGYGADEEVIYQEA